LDITRLTKYTPEQYSGREVIYDSDQSPTRLKLLVDLDTGPCTINDASCRIVFPGNNVQTAGSDADVLTTFPSSGEVEIEIPYSKFGTTGSSHSPGIQLWQTFDLIWLLTLNVDGSDVIIKQTETPWASKQYCLPSVSYSQFTASYPEYQQPQIFAGTGKTDWLWLRKQAFAELRDYMATAGPDRRAYLVSDAMAFNKLLWHWWNMLAAAFLVQRMGGDWKDRYAYHTGEVERLKVNTVTNFSIVNPYDQQTQPLRDEKTMEPPHLISGRSSETNLGGFG
jgi:hypothetical protein